MALGPCSAEDAIQARSISETAVRAISARQYSDLLRRACLNGFRFQQSDIAHGFERHFRELRLVLLDQGYAITPDTAAPRLVVTEIAVNGRTDSAAVARPGCFRARWNEE